ncbi:pyridoxal-dependent decarboxylase domain protein [Moniliophthora roreri]|nr:pyridoxal-dependent decarboxylase domain protein [Moniliophthora roreri]
MDGYNSLQSEQHRRVGFSFHNYSRDRGRKANVRNVRVQHQNRRGRGTRCMGPYCMRWKCREPGGCLVSRNLKYYPLSLRDAMAPGAPMEFIADSFEVTTCQGESKLLSALELWDLFNLKSSTILDIPDRLIRQYGMSSAWLDKVMENYIVQTVSRGPVDAAWKIDNPPQILVAATKHYSWPKAAAVSGIGSLNNVNIAVDAEARLDPDALRAALEDNFQKKRPVYCVIAVMGTTEEGAVDPLGEIVNIRSEFEKRGMTFHIHADAAWGGYFASMIRAPPAGAPVPRGKPTGYVPHVALREDTAEELRNLAKTDSITIDPHKAGYVPYPAGGLCYRDGRMRYLLTYTAPYLNQGSTDSIGIYGVEGSKPGAPASAVWMNHEVVGLHQNGLGTLLGEVSFTCRRFASHWVAMSTNETSYIVRSMNLLPSEKEPNPDPAKIEAEKQFIRDNIIGKDNADIAANDQAMLLLNQLGSDLNINAFACNFRYSDGRVNEDVEEANYLNRRIFERLSVTEPNEDPKETPFYITSTTFKQAEYGKCATILKERLGLKGDQDVLVLRNVVMSPFSTDGQFIQNLVDIFTKVLEEEVENVRKRNEEMQATHTFFVMGNDKIYLDYLPNFHRASRRFQLLASANLPSDVMADYKNARQNNPNVPILLRNVQSGVLMDMIDQGQFDATMSFDGGKTFTYKTFAVSNIERVKQRSLNNSAQNSAYPSTYSPFYLFGSSNEPNIDHMLVVHPNAQLAASGVQLNLNPPLDGAKYNSGVILFFDDVREATMQPFPAQADLGPNFFFQPGKDFRVTVYEDVFANDGDKPIDLDTLQGKAITSGTLTLPSYLYVDTENLNGEDVPEPRPSGGLMSMQTREAWVNEVDSTLGTTAAVNATGSG